MDIISDIYTLEDLDNTPAPLIEAMVNSEIEAEGHATPLLDALYIIDVVLDFITDVEWVSAPVSILNKKAVLMIDSAGQVLGEW